MSFTTADRAAIAWHEVRFALCPQPMSASPPKLLDRVRDAIRLRHYSRRTEEAYVAWIPNASSCFTGSAIRENSESRR